MNAKSPGALARLLERERLIVAVSLMGVTALAWYYLVRMAMDMPGMSISLNQLATVSAHPWTLDYGIMIFSMWGIMMIGMMLPSAAPTILLFGRVVQRSDAGTYPLLRNYLYAAGYLLAWTAFSLAATLLQWGVERLAIYAPWSVGAGPYVGALLLITAGIYQWTPLKEACLRHCRGPVDFLTRHWRQGLAGALRMGLTHGWYCVGCCWVLMLLLFVGGVMNLVVVAAITGFVLLEKLLPGGAQVGRFSGLCLVLLGLVTLARISPSPG